MSPSLRAHPPAAQLDDEPARLVVEHAPPGAEVTLELGATDELDRRWRSAATFLADDRGTVDTARHAPLSGTYEGIDPAGLTWSMGPQELGEHGSHDRFAKTTSTTLTFDATASAPGAVTATTVASRWVMAPGVRRLPASGLGWVGTAFRPPGDGPFPAVLVLSGSGGALLETVAGQIASHGFAALSLVYFGREGLPPALLGIRLEALRSGLDWLRRRRWVEEANGFGVVGTSLGAQAGLLLAAHWPDDVAAVVSYNGSGVVYESIAPPRGERGAPWTLAGEALGYVPLEADLAALARATPAAPFVSTPCYEQARRQSDRRPAARVPVEQMSAPVLLVSGGDDQVWPSDAQARMIVDDLTGLGRSGGVEHVGYPEVGHGLGPPHLPTVGRLSFRGGCRALGGTAPATARAESDAWVRTLRFLRTHLGA